MAEPRKRNVPSNAPHTGDHWDGGSEKDLRHWRAQDAEERAADFDEVPSNAPHVGDLPDTSVNSPEEVVDDVFSQWEAEDWDEQLDHEDENGAY